MHAKQNDVTILEHSPVNPNVHYKFSKDNTHKWFTNEHRRPTFDNCIMSLYVYTKYIDSPAPCQELQYYPLSMRRRCYSLQGSKVKHIPVNSTTFDCQGTIMNIMEHTDAIKVRAIIKRANCTYEGITISKTKKGIKHTKEITFRRTKW